MAKFIELPIDGGMTMLVNLNRVCGIGPGYVRGRGQLDDAKTTVWFTATEDGAMTVATPFSDVRRMVSEAMEGKQ